MAPVLSWSASTLEGRSLTPCCTTRTPGTSPSPKPTRPQPIWHREPLPGSTRSSRERTATIERLVRFSTGAPSRRTPSSRERGAGLGSSPPREREPEPITVDTGWSGRSARSDRRNCISSTNGNAPNHGVFGAAGRRRQMTPTSSGPTGGSLCYRASSTICRSRRATCSSCSPAVAGLGQSSRARSRTGASRRGGGATQPGPGTRVVQGRGDRFPIRGRSPGDVGSACEPAPVERLDRPERAASHAGPRRVLGAERDPDALACHRSKSGSRETRLCRFVTDGMSAPENLHWRQLRVRGVSNLPHVIATHPAFGDGSSGHRGL